MTRQLSFLTTAAVCLFAAHLPASADDLDDLMVSQPVLAPRISNYSIDVTLDPEAKTLTARQLVRWTNAQSLPTDELPFHLYWNAWRNNQSTWMREDRFRGRSDRGDDILEGDWSYLEIQAARLMDDGEHSQTDLTTGMLFLAPDDGNASDRTLVRFKLPRPVEPGQSIDVELEWTAKIPRTFARTGFRGDFFFIAHWFPKLGVFEDGGWTAPQYHSATEYYSDFGAYDVRMTVPTGWLLGATGRKVGVEDNGNGTTTHRHQQTDVHAFTWTTSPDYVEFTDRFEETGLDPVDIRLLMQPEHTRQKDRHLRATKAALKYYGLWYGSYPYGHLTVVDPAYGSGAGGMEYPTIFTCGTRLSNPFGGGRPEGVTIHEAGHQFWYGIVANNEFDYAWIDEGLNSFSDARVYDMEYGDAFYTKRYFDPPKSGDRGFFARLFPEFPLERALWGNGLDRYRRTAVSDIQATPTREYHPATASGISYSKTAVWLHTLERYLGWETFQGALEAFYQRSRFTHPRPEDFEAIVGEISGHELGWFFDQILRQDRWFDYAVDSAASFRVEPEGFFDEGGKVVFHGPSDEAADTDDAGDDALYRSEVVIRRLGNGTFPLEVLFRYEDGSEERKQWDGKYRWKLFVEERNTKLASVVVDPERVLLLDLDYTNNSHVLDADARLPAYKWAGRWMLWLQDLLTVFAYFA